MDPLTLTGSTAFGAGLASRVTAAAAALQSSSPDLKKARDAAQQFEGFFAGQMMESMTSEMEANPMFGGGFAEESWRSMLNQEYGKEIAKSGRLGIANSVMKTMLAAQEQRTAANTAASMGASLPPATPSAAATDAYASIVPTAAPLLPTAAPFAQRSAPRGN